MASSRRKIERICKCGTLFVTSEQAIERGWGRYCSHVCTGKFANKRVGHSSSATRERARKIWRARQGSDPACWCGKPADVHHRDGNPENNAEDNQEPLCRSHHVSLENRRR